MKNLGIPVNFDRIMTDSFGDTAWGNVLVDGIQFDYSFNEINDSTEGFIIEEKLTILKNNGLLEPLKSSKPIYNREELAQALKGEYWS